MCMKMKFESQNEIGTKIGFKLPDGHKVDYTFKDATVKVSP